jgi:tetratricopeptide (TPR) repeat protein
MRHGLPARAVAGLGLAAVLGASLWWAGRPAPAHRAQDIDRSAGLATGPVTGPVIDGDVLEVALRSQAPEHLTMSDEIEHFQARLAARGDEGFSHNRLVSAHLVRYRAYGREADLDAAERHLAARTSAGETSADLEAMRASLHLVRHEFTEAVHAARAANDLARGREPAHWLRLFDALWATGRFDEAEAILELPLDRGSIGVRSRRARSFDRAGDVDRARDEFAAVVELVRAYAEPTPVEAWALVELGHFEHHSGHPDRAVRRYLEALRILPGSPAALEGLAAVARGVDRNPEAAVRLYRHALAQGAHPNVWPVLADTEVEAGNEVEARRLREAFVEFATASPRAERLYRRPLVFVLADDPTTVCAAVDHARLDLDDRRDPGAWDALAWARYRAGDLEGAGRAARLATAAGVPEPALAWRAGLIAKASGDETRAATLLGTAVKGASELAIAEVDEARRLLAGGQPAAAGPWAPLGRADCELTPRSAPVPR